MQRKALLAILFAGGMLNSQIPALSDNKVESTDSVIEQLASNTRMTPEVRAYSLLNLARSYLVSGDRAKVEAEWRSTATGACKINLSRNWQDILISWADQFSSQKRSATRENARRMSDTGSIAAGNSALADTAIQKALAQIDQDSDKFPNLFMYFVALRLFQQVGDADGMHRCNKVLEDAFQFCEKQSTDEQQIRAASSILNSMAYGLIPVRISDFPKGDYRANSTQVEPYAENDFKKSEKLKQKAISMVDRLPASNHVRRKAHRDLVLWYLKLGKTEMAEKEKQILFELVGSNDDSILYPQDGACGHVVWWKLEKISNGIECGMG